MTAHHLTAATLERAAKALATTCNGGDWATHYTPQQRDIWRRRVSGALEDHP